MKVNYEAVKIWLAVDCLVFGYDSEDESIKVLLFPREVEPFAGEWSLIGALVEEEEDIDRATERILKKFTGLEDIYLEQLRVFGKSNRDPGGRVVSILYWSLIKLDQIKKDIVNSHGAKWFRLDEIPKLVLDHGPMTEFGKKKLLELAKGTPIGFELLPTKFTLPQLLKLYESIYRVKLDDRNFRKRMLSTGILKKLDEKDKSSSKKGAFYYQFDLDKYKELSDVGYYLDLLRMPSSNK